MSTTSTASHRQAWQDRWSKPTLSSLLDALKPHHRRCFTALMEKVESFDHVQRDIVWYGPGWKWTLQYSLTPGSPTPGTHGLHGTPGAPGSGKANGSRTGSAVASARTARGRGSAVEGNGEALAEPATGLCYLVPDANMPLLCIPMTDGFIEALPEKRLRKFIKEGIRSAKCAVQIRWATWSPSSDLETSMLTDLLRRKYDFATHAVANPLSDN